MIKSKFYANSDKESNYILASNLGLNETASDNFAYTAYELVFEIEIDEVTGDAFAVSLNGVSLDKRIKI